MATTNTKVDAFVKHKDVDGNITEVYPITKLANVLGLEDKLTELSRGAAIDMTSDYTAGSFSQAVIWAVAPSDDNSTQYRIPAGNYYIGDDEIGHREYLIVRDLAGSARMLTIIDWRDDDGNTVVGYSMYTTDSPTTTTPYLLYTVSSDDYGRIVLDGLEYHFVPPTSPDPDDYTQDVPGGKVLTVTDYGEIVWGNPGLTVTVTSSDGSTLTADKTYEEILEAWNNGISVRLRYDDLCAHLTSFSKDPSGSSILIFTTVYYNNYSGYWYNYAFKIDSSDTVSLKNIEISR